MKDWVIVLLLTMAGFSAGHSFARFTQAEVPPAFPLIVNRISEFEEEISKLESAIDRLCLAPPEG